MTFRIVLPLPVCTEFGVFSQMPGLIYEICQHVTLLDLRFAVSCGLGENMNYDGRAATAMTAVLSNRRLRSRNYWQNTSQLRLISSSVIISINALRANPSGSVGRISGPRFTVTKAVQANLTARGGKQGSRCCCNYLECSSCLCRGPTGETTAEVYTVVKQRERRQTAQRGILLTLSLVLPRDHSFRSTLRR